ncbi:DUF3875 domain-containing protein [Phocaeicola plebeius]|uniref:DUF3875 domain-containing protein n=1 Tax=Phocaeicola plebeius TaxID=310297 RepID=UPI0024200DED|nr:DUF3875 domain-containing protein [Phocaeicola plebeius]
MTTLENRFPTFSGGAWLASSQRTPDITVAFEVELPELYTVTGCGVRGDTQLLVQGYQGAAGLLRRPQTGLVHQGTLQTGASEGRHELFKPLFRASLQRASVLKHTCYLYLTKTTKERNRMQSNFSTLCRGHIIPKELDRETTTKFLEACEQFERIMNDSGLVRLRRLSTDEIVGTEGKTGLIERYFSLMPEGDTTLQDIELSAREMRIRRQPPVSAHPLRRGRPAGQGGYRHPLREALHRPE